MLLSSAEQCLGAGRRKAVFIFIKRMGNWGLWPVCLLSSPLPVWLQGTLGTPPPPLHQWEGAIRNSNPHRRTKNSSEQVPSAPVPQPGASCHTSRPPGRPAGLFPAPLYR